MSVEFESSHRKLSFSAGIIALILLSFPALIYSQSGGAFNLEFSIIAGGGGKSEGGGFSLEGTAGQSNAGTNVSGGSFNLQDGFWSFDQLAPTAALVNVGGRVIKADGQGIGKVFVTITDTTNLTYQTQTSSFGYYRFSDIPVGSTYVITVWHRKFVPNAVSQVVSINDAQDNIDFIIGKNE